MEGTLVEPLPATEPAELSELVRQPCREVVGLRKEVADLRRENAELRQQVGYWEARHARAVHRAEQLEAEVGQLRGEDRKLQDQLLGRKSETASNPDRSNRLEGEDDQTPSPSAKRGPREDRPGPSRRDSSHLPAVEDLLELPEERRVCPRCGAPHSPSDTEDSEQIEIEARAYRRRIRRRRYRRTCNRARCPRTITAPPAPELIPEGVLGVSVWVEILLDKFSGHRPTERLPGQWQLLGLDVAAGTVAGGLGRLEPLFQPLYDALLLRNAAAAFARADEARWMVFVAQDGKTGYRWWLRVSLGEDTVVFRLDPTRGHDVPEGHFPAEARVVLMVDRDSAYQAMARVKLGDVVLVSCWAHARGDLVTIGKGWPEHKEWALARLRRIGALDRHDRRRRGAPAGDAEFTTADGELRQAVAAMPAQADAELADPRLPTPGRKVLVSLQEHWSGSTGLLDDRRIPLDDNASERRVRGPALGRKNHHGSGALWSGRPAATLFSPPATSTLAKINVRAWLTWFLSCCAENGGRVPSDINPLLPWAMSLEKRREMALDPNDSS